jgi:multiple sugar transport system substrate-binding protein
MLVGVVIAAATILSACSAQPASSSSAGHVTSAEKYGTKSHPITLTFWDWGGASSDAPAVAAYEKLHPYVKVKVTEFTSTQDLYTKLATVFKAGTGAPDVTALELAMLPTFAAGGNLVPLAQYGGTNADMNSASSKAANFDNQLYAIPTDSAPTVMYYRADLFTKYGLSVPTTWAQYLTDARSLKKQDPSAYMTFADPSDSSVAQGLIWQAGGEPFKLSGTKDLTINLSDAGTTKYADLWSTMLKGQLVKSDPAFTADWYNEMGDGTYATWLTGAWGAAILQSSVEKSAGDWRVATLPSWSAGSPSAGLIGGSGTAVTASSPNKAAAAAWTQFFGTDWPEISGKGGGSGGSPFPATLKVENDPSFADKPSAVLGGQKDIPVYKTASSQVLSGWQYLPYNLYANSIFKDTVGQQFASGGDVNAGLKAWQKALAAYGTSQGFTVKAG